MFRSVLARVGAGSASDPGSRVPWCPRRSVQASRSEQPDRENERRTSIVVLFSSLSNPARTAPAFPSRTHAARCRVIPNRCAMNKARLWPLPQIFFSPPLNTPVCVGAIARLAFDHSIRIELRTHAKCHSELLFTGKVTVDWALGRRSPRGHHSCFTQNLTCIAASNQERRIRETKAGTFHIEPTIACTSAGTACNSTSAMTI